MENTDLNLANIPAIPIPVSLLDAFDEVKNYNKDARVKKTTIICVWMVLKLHAKDDIVKVVLKTAFSKSIGIGIGTFDKAIYFLMKNGFLERIPAKSRYRVYRLLYGGRLCKR